MNIYIKSIKKLIKFILSVKVLFNYGKILKMINNTLKIVNILGKVNILENNLFINLLYQNGIYNAQHL